MRLWQASGAEYQKSLEGEIGQLPLACGWRAEYDKVPSRKEIRRKESNKGGFMSPFLQFPHVQEKESLPGTLKGRKDVASVQISCCSLTWIETPKEKEKRALAAFPEGEKTPDALDNKRV